MMRRYEWLDDIVMGVLAAAAMWLAFQPDVRWVHDASVAIWVVFVAEYAVRLALARRRRFAFFRANLLDLIAIMPWDILRGARLLRLLRLLRMLRGLEVLWRVSATMRGILRTNHLRYVMLMTVAFIVAVLMIAGIGTIGMITGSIATYFLGLRGARNPHVRQVQEQLGRWDALSPRERHELGRVLAALAESAEGYDGPVGGAREARAGTPSISFRCDLRPPSGVYEARTRGRAGSEPGADVDRGPQRLLATPARASGADPPAGGGRRSGGAAASTIVARVPQKCRATVERMAAAFARALNERGIRATAQVRPVVAHVLGSVSALAAERLVEIRVDRNDKLWRGRDHAQLSR